MPPYGSMMLGVSSLSQFAKHPPDLRVELSAERIRLFQTQGIGFKLSYATERISKEILDGLFQLAKDQKVIPSMHALQAGEKLNGPAKMGKGNKAALHTALRFKKGVRPLSPGALEAAELAWKELDRLEEVLPSLDGFTDIVQVGIGGSLLGPQAIYYALKKYSIPGRKAHFISNIDPDEAASVLETLPLEKTIFVIVSKSGTTQETVTNEAIIRKELEKRGLDPILHLIAVTEQKSLMDDEKLYRACFHIWDFIGGRYSSTSMVGGVILSFTLGLDTFLQFLEGAYEMDQVALKSEPHENLPLIGALLGVWNRSFLSYPTVAVVPYSHALTYFPAHLQQLEMESNGKRVDRMGHLVKYPTAPVIWGGPGTNGQHSFFQLLHQGTEIVPVEFIGFCESQYGSDCEISGSTSQEKLNGNMIAQLLTLAQGDVWKKSQEKSTPNQEFPGNRPSHLLIAPRCDALNLGKLLSYYEHKTAFQGFLWGINSFDQEGVELGKKVARQVIQAVADDREGKKVADPLQKEFVKFIQRY